MYVDLGWVSLYTRERKKEGKKRLHIVGHLNPKTRSHLGLCSSLLWGKPYRIWFCPVNQAKIGI